MESEFVVGLTKFEWSKDKAWFPQLSPDPGVSHAVEQHLWGYRLIDLGVNEPVFYDGIGGGHPSVCGIKVRALLPIKFNGQDPDACPRCVQALADR